MYAPMSNSWQCTLLKKGSIPSRGVSILGNLLFENKSFLPFYLSGVVHQALMLPGTFWVVCITDALRKKKEHKYARYNIPIIPVGLGQLSSPIFQHQNAQLL